MGTRTRGRGGVGERLAYVDPAPVPEAPGRPRPSPADMLARAMAPLGAGRPVPGTPWAFHSSSLGPHPPAALQPQVPPQSVLGGVAGTIPEAIKLGDLHGAGASTREIYFTGDAWWLIEAVTLTWRQAGTSRGHLEGPGALGSVGLAALPCCLLDSLVQETATEEGRSRRS